MSKILGLDLGTNSIGWAVVERENGEFKLADSDDKPTKGVIIFPKGVKDEKGGNEKSCAAERTDYRSARKLKFRRKLRKYNTLKTLIEAAPVKMCPLTLEELNWWRQSTSEENGKKESFKQYPNSKAFRDWLQTEEQTNKNPYYFRDKFSREKYDWEMIKIQRMS